MTGCYIPIPIVCDDCNKAPHIGENGNWWIGNEDTGVSARGSGEELYSTEATRIGTWIDGKPLYRRVFQYSGTVPAINDNNDPDILVTVVPLSQLGTFSKIVNLNGHAFNAAQQMITIPNMRLSVIFDSAHGVRLQSKMFTVVSNVTVIVEYTV